MNLMRLVLGHSVSKVKESPTVETWIGREGVSIVLWGRWEEVRERDEGEFGAEGMGSGVGEEG